jgi:hypothetical protein
VCRLHVEVARLRSRGPAFKCGIDVDGLVDAQLVVDALLNHHNDFSLLSGPTLAHPDHGVVDCGQRERNRTSTSAVGALHSTPPVPLVNLPGKLLDVPLVVDLAAHIQFAVVAVVEFSARGLEEIVGVHIFDRVVVALVFLLVFLVDFGLVIDEDVAPRLLPSLGGASLQKSALGSRTAVRGETYNHVILVVLFIVVVIIVIVKIYAGALFVLVGVACQAERIVVVVVLHRRGFAWSRPARRLVLVINLSHGIEVLRLGRALAIVVRHCCCVAGFSNVFRGRSSRAAIDVAAAGSANAVLQRP